MAGRLRNFVGLFSAAVAGCAVVLLLLCDVIVVRGASMQNTLHDGDRVLVLRADALSHFSWLRARLLTRGRIIVFRSPMHAGEVLIKRVVATGGDTLRIDRGALIVNDRVVPADSTAIVYPQSWPPDRSGETSRRIVVPPSNYFVLSDNRLQSLDSRSFGALAPSTVVAAVIAPMWHRAPRPPEN